MSKASNRVFVSGSSSGIGFNIAKHFLLKGRDVIINGSSADNLKMAVQELVRAGIDMERVSVAEGDLTCESGINRVVEHFVKNKIKLGALICNLGSGSPAKDNIPIRQVWEDSLAINLLSPIMLIEALLDFLEKNSSIVCISSICGVEYVPGAPIEYSASKAALNAFVKCKARELSGRKVKINSLSLGNIMFPGSVWEKKAKHNHQKVMSVIEDNVALARFGEVEEIASITDAVCSDKFSFMTGANLVIDGGQVRGF